MFSKAGVFIARQFKWCVRFLERQVSALSLAPKDFITIALSGLALCVSAISAYYSVVRQADDLRLALGGEMPMMRVSKDQKYLTVGPNLKFTLVNAGNRPIVIMKIEFSARRLYFDQLNLFGKPEGCYGGTDFPYQIEPTLLKPSDLLVMNVKIANAEGIANIAYDNLSSGEHSFVGCLMFTLVTPSVIISNHAVPIATHKYDGTKQSQFLLARQVHAQNELISVYKN